MRHKPSIQLTVLLTGCLLLTGCSGFRMWKLGALITGGTHHTVRRGESLWLIGRAYGVPVEQIAVLNGIPNPDHIRAGRRLFIPGGRSWRRVPKGAGRRPKTRPRWAEPSRSKASAHKGSGGKERQKNLRGNRRTANAPRFSWPLRGRVIRRFGARGGSKMDGILIVARERATVRAAAPGRVIFSDFGPGDLGRIIILRHGEGEYHSVYARIARNLVRRGQRVSRGAPIALTGRTRRFPRAQLHFQIRHRTRPQNPLDYLPRGVSGRDLGHESPLSRFFAGSPGGVAGGGKTSARVKAMRPGDEN